ncbi:MAG: IS630 family transposase [Streptosporangiales bacterium]|nr:IS630 family transposase [Streptosporangiales bacterium]
MPIRAAEALPVTAQQRVELSRMAASTVLPHRRVVQARALLWAADGTANEEIARRSGVDSDTVRRWRKRFAQTGVDGVGVIARGRGRKSSLPPGTVEQVLRLTREETPPGGATQWTTRTMAVRVGVGKDTVARIWADHNLKPWQVDTFKLSNDPRFEEKLVDVVGVYLNPPARAVVFSFDEKTQCQALDRTQPSLPMKPGRAKTMTHDYKRHGTIDLFAAMNLATGQVLTELRNGHSAAEVLRFFKQIDKSVPRGLGVHVILDNLSAHSAPEINTWLAHKDRRRWHLHFIPTSSSWLNLIERWFKELTDKRLRRGAFTSVADLVEAITVWAEHWNSDPKPFIWKATAEDIIAKVQRGRAALRQIKTQTDH